MQRIADWLKKLGMSEYAKRFAENDIEFDILPELTDHDLERLGVSLGHRRRILRAIRELGGLAQAAPQIAAPHDNAERRQLTVLLCDLVGSTALSVKLDPEDLRGIIAAYHRCCSELVERNGGFVARYMGDGVLAYFGYPQAHEYDAERAIRAGLALVEAVPKTHDRRRSSFADAGRYCDRPRRRWRPHWRGCGPGAGGRRAPKPVISSRRCTAGSPK